MVFQFCQMKSRVPMDESNVACTLLFQAKPWECEEVSPSSKCMSIRERKEKRESKRRVNCCYNRGVQCSFSRTLREKGLSKIKLKGLSANRSHSSCPLSRLLLWHSPAKITLTFKLTSSLCSSTFFLFLFFFFLFFLKVQS